MFHVVAPSICATSESMVFDVFHYAPPVEAAPFCFAPISVVDLEAYATANAFYGLAIDGDTSAGPLPTPHDTLGSSWDILEDPSPLLWIRDDATPTSSPQRAPRARQVKDPAELARRRAHRRSLQQGYERDYRERKRHTREQLRCEWLALESALQTRMIAAQEAVAVVVKRPDERVTSGDVRELLAETRALRTEQVVLGFMLCRERRLAAAQTYFTQPEMREKLNALSTSAAPVAFQFTW